MSRQRVVFVLMASAAVLALSTSARAQNWTINQPATMTTFDERDLVTGSGMAPGANLNATFTFEQDVPGMGWVTQGTDPVVSFAQTVGGVQLFLWSQTLDPDDEQPATGQWPFSRDGFGGDKLYDYKAKIAGEGSEAAITNLRVKNIR